MHSAFFNNICAVKSSTIVVGYSEVAPSILGLIKRTCLHRDVNNVTTLYGIISVLGRTAGSCWVRVGISHIENR